MDNKTGVNQSEIRLFFLSHIFSSSRRRITMSWTGARNSDFVLFGGLTRPVKTGVMLFRSLIYFETFA